MVLDPLIAVLGSLSGFFYYAQEVAPLAVLKEDLQVSGKLEPDALLLMCNCFEGLAVAVDGFGVYVA